MKSVGKRNSKDNLFIISIAIVVTGIIFFYRLGISGNDFWWHVKAGEWIANNKALPSADVFSWYARENGIVWVLHEWLSEVVFYFIHKFSGDLGIYVFALLSAIAMLVLIAARNRKAIKNNVLLSFFYLIPAAFLFHAFFTPRPQLMSYFLLYAVLACLYAYHENEKSKAVYLVPFLSILWGNFHGGSSSLGYILCFIFMFSGVFEISAGKLESKKLSKKQICTYFAIGVFSFLALAVNPNGLKILAYPFENIGDSFLQSLISEWQAPDAKDAGQLLIFFLPFFLAGAGMVITEKKINLIDFLLFLFFSYLFFRSTRFGILFYISASFYVFRYFPLKEIKPSETKADAAVFYAIMAFLICVNVYGIAGICGTYKKGELISTALDKKFVELVKEEKPKRLYNDYNFGETLIYNNIDTFVDARADIFSKHNLKDAMDLLYLKDLNGKGGKEIFDPEKIISRYNFDAFLIETDRSLASYLKSRPDKYKLVLQYGNAAYFKRTGAN